MLYCALMFYHLLFQVPNPKSKGCNRRFFMSGINTTPTQVVPNVQDWPNPKQKICKMQLLRRKQKSPRYTPFQKQIATNILVSTSISGYRLLSTMFALPSSTTIIRSLRKFKTPPGNIQLGVGRFLFQYICDSTPKIV